MNSFCVLLVFCLVSSVELVEPIKIDMVRQKNFMEKLLEQNTHPKLLAKYFSVKAKKKIYSYNSTDSTGPRTNDTITLYKFLQSQFYGKVLIGSPGQKFKVFFDTASFDIWITSALCSPFAYPACATRNKYDSTKSTSYFADGSPFSTVTDKGQINGFLSYDKIHIGHINITNQSFAEVEQMSVLELLNLESDGIVGLGYDPRREKPSLIPHLFGEHPDLKPMFSFFFNRDETTVKGGHLYLGGYEKKYIGNNTKFNYVPVSNTYDWEFKLSKILLNYSTPYFERAIELCIRSCKAYPNTADLIIYGPENDIKIINKFLYANYVPYLGRYEIPCSQKNKMPIITFFIGDNLYTLHGRDYVEEVTYGPLKLCLSAFATLKTNKDYKAWGLGVAFLSKVYTVFDMNRRIAFISQIF